MTSEIDILRTARELINQHGLKGASDHAAGRIASSLELGDHDGASVWAQVRAALLDLSDIQFKGDQTH